MISFHLVDKADLKKLLLTVLVTISIWLLVLIVSLSATTEKQIVSAPEYSNALQPCTPSYNPGEWKETFSRDVRPGFVIDTPSSTPQLTFLSPLEGDVWEKGSRKKIAWSFEGEVETLTYKSTEMHLVCGYGNDYFKTLMSFDADVKNVPTSSTWTVPEDVFDRNDCVIQIVYLTSESTDFGGWAPELQYTFTSKPFTIITPGGEGSPKISVMSPRGGEVIKIGQPYTVQWRGEYLSGEVGIELYKGNKRIYSIFDYGGFKSVPISPTGSFGEYVWGIKDLGPQYQNGVLIRSGSPIEPGDDYRLYFTSGGGHDCRPEARVFSEPFTLVE